ncbi:MAG: Bug family tripartite tricarboxylate transporter substrate binding protein [Beijerinckiaceae bacterium]
MTKTPRIAALAASLCLAAAYAPSAHAQGVESFYKGKQVSLLIGFGPGGGNDVWGRAIARHMGRHIPGNPTMVAQNMPGAGTMKLALHLQSVAPADGSVFGMISRGLPLEPLLGDRNTQFAPQKMSWIGSPDQDTNVCAVTAASKAKTLGDLHNIEITMGGSGSGADTAVYPEFFAQFLGLKIRTVKGYPGSNEVLLAMERGEVDGICVAYDALARQRLFTDGKINILFQAALKKDPKIKGDPPLVIDANVDPAKRDILEFFLFRAAFGRPLAAPPAVPKDRLAALQKAFLDTMADPVFKAEAQKLGLTIDPISGDELAALVDQAYRTPEASVRALAELLKNLGK